MKVARKTYQGPAESSRPLFAGPGFVLEPFRPEDLVAVLTLVQRSLGEEIPYAFFLQMSTLRPEYSLVARDPATRTVVGFIVGTKDAGHEGRVLAFAVDPEAQGRGVGHALLARLQRSMLLQDVRQVHLEVRADNHRAIEFYRRHGFNVTGLEEAAYKDGADAYRMMKPLH